MSNLNVETSQNIELNFNMASVGDRIVAYIIDGLILVAILIVMAFLMAALSDTGIADALDENTAIIIVFTLIFLPISFYHLLCEYFMQGQTPGKRAVKIKVIREDGGNPNFGNYFIRWVLRIIDITLFTGGVAILAIILSEKSQRLGDMAAGTILINLKQKFSVKDTVYVKLPEDYTPSFEGVKKLKGNDIAIIKEILKESRNNDNLHLVKQLSDKTRAMLNIETEMFPKEFLEKVILDYNYFAQKEKS